MIVENSQNALPPEAAARLMAFARACKGAARAVALYPPEHRAIGEALDRLSKSAADATRGGAFSVLVLPDNLLVGGRGTAKPDAAVSELASLLHAHMVGEITIQPNVEPLAWRALLALLGRDPVQLRERGGLARALTTAGGFGIEIQELDYSGLIKDRDTGYKANWDRVIAHCLQKEALELDEETIRILGEIAADATRLGEFFERADEPRATHSVSERAGALLRALRGMIAYYRREEPARLESIFDNMAAALSHLTPETVMDLLARGREQGAEDDAAIVEQVRQRVSDKTIGEFVARSVSRDRACTARLADAFRALAPDPGRREAAVSLAREELSRQPIAGEAGFDQMWSQVEGILLAHSDKAFVSDSYNQELSNAKAHAGEMEHMLDDPPERIMGWLTTVTDSAIRALDVQLLADLLLVEPNAAARHDLLQIVVGQVDESMVLGDVDGARQLVEAMVTVANGADAAVARPQVTQALEQLLSPEFMGHLAAHLNTLREDELEPARAFCIAVGPGIVPRVAEALASETRPRARQRLTDLLVGFGKYGRKSVDQLLQSPNPSVRRTAAQLLRTFGGPEALPDLERLVNDPEPGVQREAARALIGLGFDESFTLLKRIVRTKAHKGRDAVIEELAATRDQKAKPLFCYLVKNVESRGQMPDVYLRALARLGLLGGPDAVEALAAVLGAGEWWAPFRTREVWKHAAQALAQIKLPEAQDALKQVAESGAFGARGIARAHVK